MVVLFTFTVGATSVNDEPEMMLAAFVDLAIIDWGVTVVFSVASSAADTAARLRAKRATSTMARLSKD
jgi:hypothetical protein